jgi:UTP-glucose-1-phosphate uridylyltransferase
MSSKQTSVEWLAKQLLNAEPNVLEWQKYILQAKEMHKQEIIDAWDSRNQDVIKSDGKTSEQYYQETFVSKGSDTLKDYHIVDTNEMVEIPQKEISDEEIKKTAIGMGIASSIATAYFIDGAKWYREQLKQRQ